MFHTILTIAYILPNIYLYFRLRKLFINKGYRLHYTVVFALVALIYPINTLFSENNMGFQTGIFAIAARYILPCYLYLFLTLLAYEIWLIIDKILKIVPPVIRERTSYKVAVLTTILLLSLLTVIAGKINFDTIRTTEYRLEIPRKSAGTGHVKIAFVADFHLKRSTDYHFVERFVQKISDIRPDLMIFGGDIVEGNGQDAVYAKYEQLLKKIEAPYGVYGVLGNHEFFGVQKKGRFFDHAGIRVLCDSVVTIANSFCLAGRYDHHFRERKPIAELLKTAVDSLPVILIDHRPTDIPEAAKNRIDIQFSGHTHNGQLFPFNFLVSRLYPLSYGYEKIGMSHFFVTCGIMLWGPTVRTTGKSEIVVVDVAFK